MFKKILVFSFIFALAFPVSTTFAQSNNSNDIPKFNLPTTPVSTSENINTENSNAFSKSQINVSDIKLDNTKYSAGDTVSGTIILNSTDSLDQNDVYLDISLVGDYSKEDGRFGLPDTIYDSKTVGPFVVKAGTITSAHFTYVMPKSVGGKGLGIEVNAHSIAGMPYSWKDIMLDEVVGGKTLLTIQDAYTKIDGTKHLAESGPMLTATSTINFHLVVKNPSTNAITITPNVSVHKRLSSGDLIKEYSEKPVTIPAKSSKEIIFDPYKNDNKPGVYVQDVNLLDGAGDSLAPSMQYRYIIAGDIATIHEVKFDQNSVSVNDTVSVQVFYSGSPHDIQTGQRQKIDDAVLNVQIVDAKSGAVLGTASTTPNLNVEASNSSLFVKVNGASDSIKAIANISVNGKNLAAYSTSPSVPDPEKTNENDNEQTKNFYMIILAGITGIVLIVLFYIIRKKTSRNVLMTIAILLSVVAGGVISNKNTSAVVVFNEHYISGRIGGYCPDEPIYYGGWGGRNRYQIGTQPSFCTVSFGSWNSIVLQSPTKTSFGSGETINVSGYVFSNGCANTPEDLNIYVGLRDDSGTDRVPVSSSSFHYDSSNTADHRINDAGHYSRFSYNINQHLPKGTTNIMVATYDNWTGTHNGLSRQWGWLVDYTKINIRYPVSVSCVADKTTASIGDTVNWKMTTSGGTGSYKYFWYNPVDQTDWVNSPQVTTLSKTYTTSGLKTMSAAIIDKNTGDNSNVANGGWKQCSNTVTVGNNTGALTQSCTPSSATVAINQPVIWTINASGGVPPYIYDLGDASGHSSTNTITRTYTTLGTKSMDYSVSDASRTLPVTPQACAPVSVVTNLSCTLPGAGVVENGSITRLYASTDTNCSNYTDFTCSNGVLSAGDQAVYKNARCVDASLPAAISYFAINPDTVNKNESCLMNLKVDNAKSCIITGNSGDNISVDLDTFGSALTTKKSSGLKLTTLFTLTCTNRTKDASGNFPTVTKSAKCYLNADSFEK
ncbi:MAG: hypothetical protein WCG97_00135 [bacterium]